MSGRGARGALGGRAAFALRAAALAVVLLSVGGTGSLAGVAHVVAGTPARTASSRSSPARAVFGGAVGQAGPRQLSRDAAAGLTTAYLPVYWSQAEPSRAGGLDASYLAQVESTYRRYRQAGMTVTLDPGLQYPPAWVFQLGGGTRFVDQYGDVYRAPEASGENVPDAVDDPAVQAAQARYLQLLGAALGRNAFGYVRVGGLLTGELRFPTGSYDGHQNSWWAFSAGAQQDSPVPGYRPAVSPDNRTEDRAFLHYYLSRMVAYQNFLAAATRAAFNGALEFMYPSFGVRPGFIDAAVADGLRGGSSGASELFQGVDYKALVARLPGYQAADPGAGRMIVYSTWLDAPSYGHTPASESPVAYLAALARPLHLAVAGENTASDATSRVALERCLRRFRQLRLAGLMWFDQDSLGPGRPVDASLLARGLGLSGRSG